MPNVRIFEQAVRDKFPALQGEKNRWEVRALRESHRDKIALLNNPDFFDQHTDSHSVGLIALGLKDGDDMRFVIRDLRDWDSPASRFLQDVLAGELHYYYSSNHHQTSRYQRGLNPKIISAIRYFIKLFQFELTMGQEDSAHLQTIIENFDPSQIKGWYVKNWLKRNIPKLFLHSRDVEYAWHILEKSGLRSKLLQIGSISSQGSPAWWMSKSPLPSLELGQGSGLTAAELGIKTVAHDTSDFFIWTVITRSRRGEANVFQSRQNTVGELARWGEGFYTMKNSNIGIRETGYSIRFSVDPRAREGSDFKKFFGGVILILNRKAIRVIPQSLSVENLISYFYLIREGKNGDQGFLDKTKMTLDNKYSSPTVDNQNEIAEAIAFLKKNRDPLMWQAWFSLRISSSYPEIVREMMGKMSAISKWLPTRTKKMRFIARYVLSQPPWSRHPELVEDLIHYGDELTLNTLVYHALSKPHWVPYPHLIEKLMAHRHAPLYAIAWSVLPEPHWGGHPEWVRYITQKTAHSTIIWGVGEALTRPHWSDSPQLIEELITNQRMPHSRLAADILAQSHWAEHPELVELLLQQHSGPHVLHDLTEFVLCHKHWTNSPHLVKLLIAKSITYGPSMSKSLLNGIQRCIISTPHWRKHPQLQDELVTIEGEVVLWRLAVRTVRKSRWGNYPQLLDAVVSHGEPSDLKLAIRYISTQPDGAVHTQQMEKLLTRKRELATASRSGVDQMLQRHILHQLQWRNNPRLIEVSGGEPNLQNLEWGVSHGLVPRCGKD